MFKNRQYPQQVGGGQVHLYLGESDQCLKSDSIPNKWGWPGSPQPCGNQIDVDYPL